MKLIWWTSGKNVKRHWNLTHQKTSKSTWKWIGPLTAKTIVRIDFSEHVKRINIHSRSSWLGKWTLFVGCNKLVYGVFLKWSQLSAHCFLVYLFQLRYMFRYFLLYMSGCLVGWLADQTATHTEWKIPVSHRYSYIKFSWRWEHCCPKHVEKLK